MRKGKTAICDQDDVKDACKVTCDVCRLPCIDDPGFHHGGNEKKTCEWVSKKKKKTGKSCARMEKSKLPAYGPAECATTTNRNVKLSYQ